MFLGRYVFRRLEFRVFLYHRAMISQDFSGTIAKEVNFRGSDLRGTRFFKADLKKADFTGANLGTASLEEADLDGSVLLLR